MAIYTFNDKSGLKIDIKFNLASGISLNIEKNGNTRTFKVRRCGPNLINDKAFVEIIEFFTDSESTNLLPSGYKTASELSQGGKLFTDMLNFIDDLGKNGLAMASVNTIVYSKMDGLLIFNSIGDFISPVFFELEKTGDTEITATILEANGYADLEVRFEILGVWGAWESIAGPVIKPGLEPGQYKAQVRSSGTSLIIEPIEAVNV